MTQADWLAGGAPGTADKVTAQLSGIYIEAGLCYRGEPDGRLSWSPSPDSAASASSLSSPPALLAPVAPQARLQTLHYNLKPDRGKLGRIV